MTRPAKLLVTFLLLALVHDARAALQFDAFPGFGSTIHQAEWFPITFEIHNDGPSFNGIIEVRPHGNQDQVRRIPIELPTNTRKRLTIPMFASGHVYSRETWDAVLYDSGGKMRAERPQMQTTMLAWETPLLGAVPKTFGGLPVYPEPSNKAGPEAKPTIARIQAEQFPDNPIALEGLDTLYLNSEKAIELRPEQINALIAWVRGSGHLILAVEQIGDITATPWLRQFVPMELTGAQNAEIFGPVSDWIKRPETLTSLSVRSQLENDQSFYANLPSDPAYKESPVAIATGTVKDATVLIGNDLPLAVTAVRGRGRVTLLTFSPEREPFRSWKHRGYFWARLTEVPATLFADSHNSIHGGVMTDGIFGALIDSRQIKKLPVTWLLILLLVYLVVIGPFDQWWLKKIGRQMLTWITFPAYVVLFSLLIYFIGYKLRAGETEWNELSVVDVFPRGEQVDLRGRTYISIYSSGNARYQLAGQKGYATLRSEMADIHGGGSRDGQITTQHQGNSYKAEVFVPVWTSFLFVNDWFKTNDTPFVASVSGKPSDRQVDLQNLLKVPLKDVRVAVDDRIHELGDLQPGESRTYKINADGGTPLASFIQQNGSYFQQAVDGRRTALGSSSAGRLENRPLTAMTASFTGYLNNAYAENQRGFVAPAGLDLSAQSLRGDAIILAFVPNQSLSDDINQFTPPRLQRDTLLRLVLPLKKNQNPI